MVVELIVWARANECAHDTFLMMFSTSLLEDPISDIIMVDFTRIRYCPMV